VREEYSQQVPYGYTTTSNTQYVTGGSGVNQGYTTTTTGQQGYTTGTYVTGGSGVRGSNVRQ
jgi:hypothetical protein